MLSGGCSYAWPSVWNESQKIDMENELISWVSRNYLIAAASTKSKGFR